MTDTLMDLEALLEEKFSSLKTEKSFLKENVNILEEKLKNLKKVAGPKPYESLNEINSLIEKKELTHATNSQSKYEEKKLMIELEKLRLKKKDILHYQRFSDEIELLVSSIFHSKQQILTKDAAIEDVSFGLKKIKLCRRIGCNSSDLIYSEFKIDPSKVYIIIGRGGSTLENIETEFGVHIDIDQSSNSLKILGHPLSIDKAYDYICVLQDTIIDEFSLPKETLICLGLNNNLLLNEIKSKFNVKVDYSYSKSICKLVGRTQDVQTAKQFIYNISSGKTDLLVDPQHIHLIIGKGGVTVKSIESEFSVAISLDKNKHFVEITGFKNQVSQAINKIKDIIADNRETEEILKVEKFIFHACLLPIEEFKNAGKRFGVKIEYIMPKEQSMYQLKVKGANSKVSSASMFLSHLINSYSAKISTVTIEGEFIPIIIGKGGSNINLIREKYPLSNIELEGEILKVFHIDETVKANITREIFDIIGQNFSLKISCVEDFAIMLKSKKGASIRSKILDDFSLSMSIDSDNSFIKLKGLQMNVTAGIEYLKSNIQQYQCRLTILDEDDFKSVLRTIDNKNFLDVLKTKYDIEISILKDKFSLALKGNPDDINLAASELEKFLNGDLLIGSLLLSVDTSFLPIIVGKSGSQLKKFENLHNVHIDILNIKSSLRIRGESNNIILTKFYILDFVQRFKITKTITFNQNSYNYKLWKGIFTEIFSLDVQIDPSNDNISILHGASRNIKEATKLYFEENQGFFLIQLGSSILEDLFTICKPNVLKFQTKYNVILTRNDEYLKVSTSSHTIFHIKKELIKFIFHLFKSKIAFLELSMNCIKDILTTNILDKISQINCLIDWDRRFGLLWLISDPNDLEMAKSIINEEYNTWLESHLTISVESSYIPLMFRKNGSNLLEIQKQSNCSINVNKYTSTIEICRHDSNNSELMLAENLINDLLVDLKKTNQFISLPKDLAPFFIGKRGSIISKFREETRTSIDYDENTQMIKINGQSDYVELAKSNILTFLSTLNNNPIDSKTFSFPKISFPILIGHKGKTINDIQEKSHCSIKLIGETETITLRGSSENIPTALKLINEVLLNANVPILLKFQEEIEDAPDVFDVEDKNPSQENNSNMKGKSKSALKRFRKKLSRLSGPSAIETINNILFPDSSSFSNELKQDNLADPKVLEAYITDREESHLTYLIENIIPDDKFFNFLPPGLQQPSIQSQTPSNSCLNTEENFVETIRTSKNQDPSSITLKKLIVRL